MRKLVKRKGFTTVELVIVIAVIAILATALIPTFRGLVDSANETKYMQQARQAYHGYLLDDSNNIDDTFYIQTPIGYYNVINGQLNLIIDSTITPNCGDVVITFDAATDYTIVPMAHSFNGAHECSVCGAINHIWGDTTNGRMICTYCGVENPEHRHTWVFWGYDADSNDVYFCNTCEKIHTTCQCYCIPYDTRCDVCNQNIN